MAAPLAEPAVKAMIVAEWHKYAVDVVSDNRIGESGGVALVTDILVEIVRHESDFNPAAIGEEGEVGLFQIHPVNWERYHTNKVALMVPLTNVHIARLIWEEAGKYGDGGMNLAAAFSPWTTYPQALETVHTNPRDIPGNATESDLYPGQLELEGSLTDWASGLKAFLNTILNPDFWKRIGLGALGIFVILVALVLYNKDTIMSVASKGMISKGKGDAE